MCLNLLSTQSASQWFRLSQDRLDAALLLVHGRAGLSTDNAIT